MESKGSNERRSECKTSKRIAKPKETEAVLECKVQSRIGNWGEECREY